MAIKTYYDTTNFRNVFYALKEAVQTYFADIYFSGDRSRIVYAPNDSAFIKRCPSQEFNNLNLPFMNFRMMSMEKNGNRNWFSMPGFSKGAGNDAFSRGAWIPELQRKIRMSPVTYTFESTFYFGQDLDYQFASKKLMDDDLAETKIDYSVNIEGLEIDLLGILESQLDMAPQYNEREWLEQNKIWAPQNNFTAQTFMIQDSSPVYPTDKVILNYIDVIPTDPLDKEKVIETLTSEII
ncbi:MAG: hypothetical protein WCO84_06370 [bacterium]